MKSSRVIVTSNLANLMGISAATVCVVAGVALAQDGGAPATGAAPGAAATASTTATPATTADGWCVLTGDNVYVRVAPDTQLGYPFAKLGKGCVVKVVERENGWARVIAEGPSFSGGTAYILADSRTTLSEDGKSLTLDKNAPVLAPDLLRSNDPASAWKVIATMNKGTTVPVVDVQRVGTKQYVRVALPKTAEGWVSETFLAAASAGDLDAAINRATLAANRGDATTAGTATTDTGTGSAATTTSTDGATATTTTGEESVASESASEEVDTRFQAHAPSAEQLARERNLQTFKDLESIWVSVRKESIENEELAALGARYSLLAVELANQPSLLLQVKARAEQLKIQLEVQESIQTLAALRAQREREKDEIRAVAQAIEARSDFNVVGNLNASIVYEGTKLPLLYRVQDPTTGATVAYVQPQEGISADLLATMLGTLVGIKGEVAFDPSLGVNLVRPRAIESLTATTTVDTSPAPAAGDEPSSE